MSAGGVPSSGATALPGSGATALPIDAALSGIVAALQQRGALVLVAEPGAGKTTRVPPALMHALSRSAQGAPGQGGQQDGEIWVLQPRRIAARMAARRVASELGEAVGQRIGYQVRFEDVSSKHTRVRFVTEAILTRRLLRDPQLAGVAAVVLDEFHERSIHADLALSLVRKLRAGKRPDLLLLVMSATLSAEPVAAFLGCEVHHVQGRSHGVDLSYEAMPDERPLDRRVASAVATLLREGVDGDILVFLPGAGEIRRAAELCRQPCHSAGVELHMLYGELPPAEQDRAVSPGKRPKLILSTNLAETSLTIEGVTVVLDSGFARVAGHSPFSGLPTLQLRPISRASATQRAGRAGRVRAGRCLRMYTRHDFDTRPAHDVPEISRSDLAETWLLLAAMGDPLGREDWLEPPPQAAADSAAALLRMLGAVDADGALTARGQRMASMPLHPRLARIVLEAEAREVGSEGCLFAALLSERDVVAGSRGGDGGRGGHGGRHRDVELGPSDLLQRRDAVRELQDAGLSASAARSAKLDLGVVRRVLDTEKRLRRLLQGGDAESGFGAADEPMLMSLLAGFGDRVAARSRRASPRGTAASARRDSSQSDLLAFAHGGSATQAPESVVRDAPFVVVLDAAELGGKRRGVSARLVSAIEPEWLLELFPDAIADHSETRFNASTECVETVSGLSYGSVMLDESRRTDLGGAAVEATLVQAARERGLANLFELGEAETVLRRWRFAAASSDLPACPDDALDQALKSAAVGARTFADLRRANLADHLSGLLPHAAFAKLQQLAPSHIKLPGGRKLQVNYEVDRPPWVQSRLQDFFGMAEGPRLGGEPLVLHLLAPNRRAVQVTTDLSGFWQRHYPDLRKQLMRKYARHDWSEDPVNAQPSEPVRRPRRK